jgi:FK506-binding protein 2
LPYYKITDILTTTNRPNPTTVTKNIQKTHEEDGLQIETLIKPTNCPRKVESGDVISVHYSGELTNGNIFDSSYQRNEPFIFQIGKGQVIKGWDQGIIGMCIGEKRELVIQPELGYGQRVSTDKNHFQKLD